MNSQRAMGYNRAIRLAHCPRPLCAPAVYVNYHMVKQLVIDVIDNPV